MVPSISLHGSPIPEVISHYQPIYSSASVITNLPLGKDGGRAWMRNPKGTFSNDKVFRLHSTPGVCI